MTEKRIVRGLLDLAVADMPSDKAAIDVPCMGFDFGAGRAAGETDERLTDIGCDASYAAEMLKQKKQSVGRPQKVMVLKSDNLRAFHLWLLAQEFPESLRSEQTVSRLIAFLLKNIVLNANTERLWKIGDTESLEQSVSRGRTYWEIDKNWNSPKCDVFWNDRRSGQKSLSFKDPTCSKFHS